MTSCLPPRRARVSAVARRTRSDPGQPRDDLFEHGTITTTEAKARVLRPFAEKLITKAKRGDLHNRRQVMSVIRDKTVVHVLFTEIGPRYAERPGGYTRITKLGPRKGDNAPMAVIELVEEEFTAKVRSTKTSDKPAKKATPAEPAVDESTDETTEASHGRVDRCRDRAGRGPGGRCRPGARGRVDR